MHVLCDVLRQDVYQEGSSDGKHVTHYELGIGVGTDLIVVTRGDGVGFGAFYMRLAMVKMLEASGLLQ